jgi:hypothetical protein
VPRKLAFFVSALGVVVAVALAIIPVTVHFAADPLLRLRQLDPQLSPPAATADCGSPLRSLNTRAKSTSLFDFALASACRHAARRRVLIAVASGSILVLAGLLSLAAAAAEPQQTFRGGIPSGRGGRGRDTEQAGG